MIDHSIAEVVVRKLAVHLGPNVSRMAIATFAQNAVGRTPELLTHSDIPKLIEAIRPMLAVMIGKAPGEAVLADIARACQGVVLVPGAAARSGARPKTW